MSSDAIPCQQQRFTVLLVSLWHIICNRNRLQTAIQCLGFCTVHSITVHPLDNDQIGRQQDI